MRERTPKTQHNLERVYNYLIKYQKEHGFLPNYREIADALYVKSLSTVKYYLDMLIREGKIEKIAKNSKRALKVKNPYLAQIDTQYTNIIEFDITHKDDLLNENNIINNFQIDKKFFNNTVILYLFDCFKNPNVKIDGALEFDQILIEPSEKSLFRELSLIYYLDMQGNDRLSLGFVEDGTDEWYIIRIPGSAMPVQYAKKFIIYGKVVSIIRRFDVI